MPPPTLFAIAGAIGFLEVWLQLTVLKRVGGLVPTGHGGPHCEISPIVAISCLSCILKLCAESRFVVEGRSNMSKDLTVTLEDHPGALADLGEALGKASINIDGLCGIPGGGKGVVHFLVEDVAGARRALEDVGIHVEGESDVLVVDVQDRPGELGKTCRKIADAGVNINLTYFSMKGLVVGVDDLDKARAALA